MTTIGKSIVGTLTGISLVIGFYTFGVSQGKDQLKHEIKELEVVLMQKNEELKQLRKVSPMTGEKLKSEIDIVRRSKVRKTKKRE